jgi:hypothetical protein
MNRKIVSHEDVDWIHLFHNSAQLERWSSCGFIKVSHDKCHNRLFLVWCPDLLDSSTSLVTVFYISLLHTHTHTQSRTHSHTLLSTVRVHCRCLVAASNYGRTPFLWVPKLSPPQLLFSHNSPQWPNLGNFLTNSRTKFSLSSHVSCL